MAFYRNCYENSIQSSDKILLLLSCECISSYVQTVFDLFESNLWSGEHEPAETPTSAASNFALDFDQTFQKHFDLIRPDSEDQLMDFLIRDEAASFVQKLENWLNNSESLDDYNNRNNKNEKISNLDFAIKQLCLEIIQKNVIQKRAARGGIDHTELEEIHLNIFQRSLYSNTNKIYAAVYMSLYMLVKFDADLNRRFSLTPLVFDKNESYLYKSYFIHRCLAYDDADYINSSLTKAASDHDHLERSYFIYWLGCVHDDLLKLSESKAMKFSMKFSSSLGLRLVLKQIDAVTKFRISHNNTIPGALANDRGTHKFKSPRLSGFIKKLLKNSWTYLVDVLAAFLLNTNFSCIETPLFAHSTKYIDLVNNTDFALTLFALRSCLESLDQIVRMITSLSSMSKELNQLYFLLLESNYFQSNSTNSNSGISNSSSSSSLSLNKIICIDFVLFSASYLLLQQPLKSLTNSSSQDLLWKFLIESIFFCFNLQASSSQAAAASFDDQQSRDQGDRKYPVKIGKLLLSRLGGGSDTHSIAAKKAALFESIHFSIGSETITLNRSLSCPNNESSAAPTTDLDAEALGLDDSDADEDKEPNLAHLKYELIIRSLFRFLNKSDRREYRTKFDLIDQLSVGVDQWLFGSLLDEWNVASSSSSWNENGHKFESVWKFCSHICLFSKKCLLDDLSLRAARHEYFTFNTLMIDKIEDTLIRLMNRACSINQPFVFTEIWLGVFVAYLHKIFKQSRSSASAAAARRRGRGPRRNKSDKRDQVKIKLNNI